MQHIEARFTEIKKQLEELQEKITTRCPGAERKEIIDYFIAATLTVWGSNLLYANDYTTLLNVATGENYTAEQTIAAMRCCHEKSSVLLVPEFFKKVVRAEMLDPRGDAQHVLEYLNDLLVACAMINGDFTIEEANCLSLIIGKLAGFAKFLGADVKDTPDNKNLITGRKLETYVITSDGFDAAVRDAKSAGEEPDNTRRQPGLKPENIKNQLNSTNELLSGGGSRKDGPRRVTDNGSRSADRTGAAKSGGAQAGGNDETAESLLRELDGLVGLDNVKRDVHSLMNFIKISKIRGSRGLKVPTISYHLVFTGNPGTGKTTVARLVARLYYHMGILPEGRLVEADRSDLVAGYIGQTALKTQEVIKSAMGGVLFIDEAYSLANDEKDSYGYEAVETLIKAMEDHRNELVVIVAGYPEQMRKFIDSNPGLSSRFNKYFYYPDYTGSELSRIFDCFCEKNGYSLNEEARMMLSAHFEQLYKERDAHFGNARTARNIFEKAIHAQADRLAKKDDISDNDLETLTAEDIASATRKKR